MSKQSDAVVRPESAPPTLTPELDSMSWALEPYIGSSSTATPAQVTVSSQPTSRSMPATSLQQRQPITAFLETDRPTQRLSNSSPCATEGAPRNSRQFSMTPGTSTSLSVTPQAELFANAEESPAFLFNGPRTPTAQDGTAPPYRRPSLQRSSATRYSSSVASDEAPLNLNKSAPVPVLGQAEKAAAAVTGDRRGSSSSGSKDALERRPSSLHSIEKHTPMNRHRRRSAEQRSARKNSSDDYDFGGPLLSNSAESYSDYGYDDSNYPSGEARTPNSKKSGKGRYRRRSIDSSDSAAFRAAQQRRVSGLDQLLSVTTRQALQMFRQPCSLVMEVIVPIIFVAVAIMLWAVWGGVEYTSKSFMPVTYPGMAFLEHPEASYACVNLSAFSAGIGSLPPCASVAYEYVCDGDYSAVPFPPRSICRHKDTPFSRLTVAYVNSMIDNTTRVPSLDTLITFQMMAQLDIGLLEQLGSTAVSRLYPMTVYNALVSSGYLYFVGEDTFTSALILHMSGLSNLVPVFSDPVVYSTVAEARSMVIPGTMVWAIVEIRSSSATELDLVLHMNNSALPSFGVVNDPAYPGGALTETSELYMASGFNTLQQVITEFYLDYHGLFKSSQTHIIAPFGYPSYVRIPLLLTTRAILPLIFGIAYLYTVSQQVKRIVLEKELRIREAMLIMGLKQWTLYVSDFLVQLAVLLVIAVLSAVLLKITFITRSDALILLLIFVLFSITTVPLSGIIAAFFSKSRLASLVAPVIYFILVIPIFAMTNAHGPIITGFSVLSPTAFCAALNILFTHEVGRGFGGSDFRSHVDNPTLALLLVMMAADFVFYYLLMLYLDAVVPKEWGTPKHPLFFIIDPVRWCCGSRAERLEGGPDGRAEQGVFETTDYADDVVSFDGLRKEYSRGGKTFVAVNNLYWGMREGEISVLLGHNGAGKTTLLNMMTGMITPDQGDCYIYGHSVRRELSTVRQELGYCPQHNILWNELTCRDHLEFYGKIKGLKGWELEDAVCRMLHETDLLDKMDQTAGSLSGGMKRKLSIAIAFVGGSRLVFLDEPSAGLDVAARRYVWELLQRMALRHTILLTTHYMDEADLLGSRIGIMSQGRLKCTGSSLFLKSRMGVGYNIVISVDPELDYKVIDAFVLSSVDGAKVQGRNGTELTYLLPSGSVDQFPHFLNEIDSAKHDGIRGYALSATTLEEVFLKVSEEDLECRGSTVSHEQMGRIWTCALEESAWKTQFGALLAKRFWCATRDRRMQCFQIVCPVLCILIAMLLTLIKFGVPQQLAMDYAMFNEPSTPVLLTSGCDSLLGKGTSPAGVMRNETYFQTGEMLSDFALDTWFFHRRARFGGLSCNEPTLVSPYVTTSIKNVHFLNTTSHHQSAISLATYYDQLVKHSSGAEHTIKHTAAVLDKADASSALTFIFVGTLIMIPMSFLPSNCVAWIVKERECGSRHLQNLCGLNFYVYWVTNYIFDMIAYLISMCLCILIFAIFSREEFIGNDRVGACFTIFFLYGLTSTVGAYAISFAFNEHANAQTMVMAVGLILGFLLNVIVFVLRLRSDAANTADNLRYIFRLVPSYSIGEGVISMLMLSSNIALGNARGPWEMDQLGWPMVYLGVEVPVFWLLTLLFDHPTLGRLLQRRGYKRDCMPVIAPDEDADVTEERMGVYAAEKGTEDATDVVRVVDLQKSYGKDKLAVKGITFSLFPGEVFAFLGTNGAGKTTTISMLCQQLFPSAGRAAICGHDIVTNSREALRCIGYCPQFDATLDLLTVEEQLQLYAALRGVSKAERDALVDALCTLCELTLYRKTVTGELSGGNRRKLSVAMSLVGGPRVLFLDEPSAGMDPVARRGMWTAIQRAARHCSVVLTTHHLEEVEALADMVAIMVKGHIRCIGDKVHLKNKFGSAFEVSVRVESAAYAGRVLEFFETAFPNAVQNEGDGCRYVYRLPRDRKFGDIFSILQANKQRLHITDYSVSQTSIEQVFLRVAESSAHL